MTKPDFRKMLKSLARWATSVKDYLEYQARHGKSPPRLDELKAEVLQALGIKVSYLPNPSLALVSKRRKKVGGPFPVNLVFDISGDPFDQLFGVVQSVLEFPEKRWPAGVAGSKGINELWAMLRPIAEQGGRRPNIAELGRVAAVVKSILSKKAIEGSGPELGGVTKVAKSILGGKPTEAKKPPGFGLWELPKGTIKGFSRLMPSLEAYLTGKKEHDLAGYDYPYQIQSLLKKLIKSAQEFEFKPDPNRWPKVKKQDDGGMILCFHAKEDAPGWWRPASRMGPVDDSM